MNVETCFGIAFLVGLAVGIVLVIHGTIAKNRWGSISTASNVRPAES